MGFSEIIGQDRALELLRRLWINQRHPSFILFLGPEGVGRRWAATFYAQALLCPSPDAQEGGCGHCDSCRRVFRGSHPDFCLINFSYQKAVLDKPASNLSLGIDTFRQAVSALRRTPVMARRSIALVDGAELLTPEAQVSLLKVLEEAPRHLHWLWVANSEDSLLETVVSRANFKIFFKPLDAEALAGILKEKFLLDPERAGRLARSSSGSLQAARRLLEKKGISAGLGNQATVRSASEVYEISQRLARFRSYKAARGQVQEFLDEIHSDYLERWREEATPRNLRRLRSILEARQNLDANLTPSLVLEYLLLELSDR
ncbi:MAG: hypothetical protein AAB091_04760 [Elusimicrobiota bacterium]